jgi:hypothetical protein
MKKAAAIFLLVLLVSIQTPIGQLFKFPLLVEHFMKHQKQQGISLLGFLEDHYATNHQDTDLPEDQELPFKNVAFYSIGYAIVTPFIQAKTITPLPAEKKVFIPHFYTPQQHLASIFHPPRV